MAAGLIENLKDDYDLSVNCSLRIHSDHEQYFDFIQSSSISHTSVKGRLKQHIQFWYDIGASSYITGVLRHGYLIPFIHTCCTPSSVFLHNNRSALDNMPFVTEAVADLVNTGRVIEMPFRPLVVNPLTVSINRSGKKRLILDLRYVNKFIWKEKITFQDIRLWLDYVQKDGFMCKFDLTSGYHHIDISTKHQMFLGFCLSQGGRDRFYLLD